MARMNYVKARRKGKKTGNRDFKCQKCGKVIKIGDPYKWLQNFRSAKRIWCMDCTPRRSETCNNLKGEAMDAFDDATEAIRGFDGDSGEDLATLIEEQCSMVAEALESVGQQYRDVADEHFSGGGPSAEAADEMESMKDEVEGISVDIESYDDWSFDSTGTGLKEHTDEYEEARREAYGEYLDDKKEEYASELEGADQL